MTSTILSGKTFPKLFKWSFRRNRPIMVIFGVIMALGIILDLYVISQYTQESFYGTTLESEIASIGYVSIIIAQGGAMLLTFISALITFSYLHNKRSTDMFGALPTTRATMYLSHLLSGIAAVAAPFVIGSLAVMGITCRTTDYLMPDVMLILIGIIGIIASYSFTSVVAYCCGTILDTAIIALAANGIYAGCVGLFWGLASEMIPGIDFETALNIPVFPLFAPFSLCFFGDYYFTAGEFSTFGFTLIWGIIFTAAMIALGFYVSMKRKAESAQSDFNIKWVPIAVKAGVSVVCGGLIGCIAAISSESGYSNMIIFAFWYLIVSFVAFFILHVILQRGLKGKFLPSFAAYIGTTVAILALVFGMTYGLGLDTYVPSPAAVRSVKFGYDDIAYKDPENIKTITEIHKLITEGVREDEGYPYFLGSDRNNYNRYAYVDDYEYLDNNTVATGDEAEIKDDLENNYEKYPLCMSTGFHFRYSKKIGFATARDYYISHYNNCYDFAKIEALLQKLYNSEEFKKKDEPAVWNEKLRKEHNLYNAPTIQYMVYNYTSENYYTRYSTLGSTTLPQNDKFIDGLCEALAKDILADDTYYATRCYRSESAIYGKTYMALTIDYEDTNYYSLFDEFRTMTFADINVQIKENYTNTIAYLESNFIKTSIGYSELTTSFATPTDMFADSNDAYSDYIAFGIDGSEHTLRNLVYSVSDTLELTALMRADIHVDISSWNESNGEEFNQKLTERALQLFEEYKKDPANITSDYRTTYLEDQGATNDGKYYKIADMILSQLDTECESIVNDISPVIKK